MRIAIFITCPNKKEARKIGQALVEKRLAACVNIVEKVESIFRWQDKLDKAKEVLLLVKSKRRQFPKVIRLVKSLHSYSVPEIIAFDITLGEKNYLNWIDESIRKSD